MSRALKGFQLENIDVISDDFNDSSIHDRWTVTNTDGVNITVSEDTDSLKVAFSGSGTGDQIAGLEWDVPDEYQYRNFIFEAHAKFGAGTHDDVNIALKLIGKDSAAVDNYALIGLNRDDGSYRLLAVDRGGSHRITVMASQIPTLWLRFRVSLDKIYMDYYEADFTDDPNDQDKWRQYTNSPYPPWERVPTSAPPYDYPQKIDKIRFEINTWDTYQAVTCEVRKFRLRVF